MAAALDRSALSDDAAPPRYPWLLLIAALLCVALLAVVLLEGRQLLRLTASLRSGSEQRVVQVHRQQIEYLQLREQWQRALDEAVPLDARMLALRYDIWVGRVLMLRDDAALRDLVSAGEPTAVAEALRKVEAFIARADPLFADRRTPSRAELSALHGQLLGLDEEMNDFALNAAHRVSNELTERHLTLRQYTQLTIALTAFLSLLVLAFAGLALRQMRQLDLRRRALETLAGELRQARAEAEAANQAKSAFLANMSHEIRTPFQGLLGMLSVLRESGLTARQVHLLRTATESADHLLAIVNDLLDISQLEAGRLTLMPVTVELRALLQEVEALMRPQAAAKQLALHLDADPAVPEYVLLDPTRVRQILFNLLSNAIKYSERGTVVLDIRPRQGHAGDEQLEFVVTDTGVGMGEATIERLFQRFSRADDNPGAAPPPGTGLGLEISRNLARLMGGDIEVASRPGEGSRFTFRMPLQRAERPPLAAAAPLPAGRAAQPLHVLVAEDHATNRQVLAALLDSMGHRTYFVADGDEAVAAVRAQRFDLVLMDLHMPGTDGIAATRAIRALPERRAATVPIVALTADAYADTRERCLVAGMNDFLTKPVGRENLGAVLRQLFGAASGAEPAGGEPARSQLADGGDARTPALLDAATVASALQVLSAERFGSLVREFLDQAPGTVDRLRAAVRDAQPLELRVHAHAARGAALNLGLAALAATAEGLQNGATHLPAHEIARLVQRFEDLLPLTRAAARQAGLLPEMAPP